MKFNNESVIITGAGSGIGKATAIEFGNEGAKVVVSDINVEAGNKTVEQINKNGGTAIFIKADVASDKEVESLIDGCVKNFGSLDHIINNAGIGNGFNFFADITNEHYERLVAVNQTGLFYCMRAALKVMRTQEKGSIINLSSAAGLGAAPTMAVYAATKHAVIGFTKTAAKEYGKYNIRVNAICPTVIETPMGEDYLQDNEKIKQIMIKSVPMRRFGKAEEVAKTICWLSSKDASYLNGVALPVDGGSIA